MSEPRASSAARSGRDSLWYKSAVIYQVHVRSYSDSNGDGIGDLKGLCEKLDYLQDLGVTALWLLPFYPSPLRDDGYDIADYTNVHPDYGTLHDLKTLLREAHRRDLRVVTELVINHTSDQHPWFQRARRARPGSSHRDFYVWSDTPQRYQGTRIIFKDFETSNWTWDPLAGAYYWHRFYSHQPDLNFDNPEVRRAVVQVMNFWLDLGVDGFRLDAVPYLFEREGTTNENLPETHAFLRELRRHVDERYGDRLLLAEANQWPEDAVQYFGAGDECHMAFHFPLMPRLFMGLRMEDRFPIVDILQQTPSIPASAQWAIFLRNHDELTLEMVTDEARDYMYRVYANDPRARINLGIRRRLAPLLGNDTRRIELMNSLLLSLPGTPVLYYGDEIGMGDNIFLGDRNGVRTPMQWSFDRNAGFSRANPQRLFLPPITDPEYHYESVNVEAQQQNPHSRLWWLKRIIALRKRHAVFGTGSFEFLTPENRKVLAFVRRSDEETALVVANLSRFCQSVALDLAKFAGQRPVETFGRTAFPPIGDAPYVLTLGPHGFYWFLIGHEAQPSAGAAAAPPLELAVAPEWDAVLLERNRAGLLAALQRYLQRARWFGGKARRVVSVRVEDVVPLTAEDLDARLLLIGVEYVEGEPETYLLPLGFVTGAEAAEVETSRPSAVVASLRVSGAGGSTEDGWLCDLASSAAFSRLLLEAIARRRRLRGAGDNLVAMQTAAFREFVPTGGALPRPTPILAEQTNSSTLFGDRFVLKLFRRIEPGVNPDLEIGRFLTERAAFPHTPPVAGAVEYHRAIGEPVTLAVLHGFTPNQGDAWRFTLDAVGRYFDRVLSNAAAAPPALERGLVETAAGELPAHVGELLGTYCEPALLLGRRTAEMHLALASDDSDPAFAPEPFPPNHQRSLYQSARDAVHGALELLAASTASLPAEAARLAVQVRALEARLVDRCRAITGEALTGRRVRTHGDFHLGQVLLAGRDVAIIDFEGEPARSISERRLKRSALRDVAGMLRSFQYAAFSALLQSGHTRPADENLLLPWAWSWADWASAVFLHAYLEVCGTAPFTPRHLTEAQVLLDHFLLEKTAYELRYELNHRPAWVRIPLESLLRFARR